MSKEQQDKHLELPKRAVAYVKSKLTFGSNSKAGSEVSGWDPERAFAVRTLISDTIQHVLKTHKSISQDDMNDIVTLAMKSIGYGQCGEQAFAAYRYLKQLMIKEQYACALDLCITTVGQHNLVVIGRSLDSADTWGEDAVICDPWAEKCYPLSQFKEMQKPENEVKYAEWCYDGRLLPHYLAGTITSLHRCASAADVCAPGGSSYIPSAAPAPMSSFVTSIPLLAPPKSIPQTSPSEGNVSTPSMY